MNFPPDVSFEYGLDPHSARYYGVIRLPDGEFLTTGPTGHNVEEAVQRARAILCSLWTLCQEANADA